jgi:hypothetical protein
MKQRLTDNAILLVSNTVPFVAALHPQNMKIASPAQIKPEAIMTAPDTPLP